MNFPRLICRLFGHRVYVVKDEPVIPAFFVCDRCGKGERALKMLVTANQRNLGAGGIEPPSPAYMGGMPRTSAPVLPKKSIG